MLINAKDLHQWTYLKNLKKKEKDTYYLGLFDTNYIIFRNVDF